MSVRVNALEMLIIIFISNQIENQLKNCKITGVVLKCVSFDILNAFESEI